MFAERWVVMIYDIRKTDKGFTLIELMVVIFIVGILSAVAIPLMQGRTDAARWSEGRTIAGTIRSTIRAYNAEKGPVYPNYAAELVGDVTTFGVPLGFIATDFDGKYFKGTDFTIENVSLDASGNLQYTIRITTVGSPDAPSAPSQMTLNEAGTFTEIP